MWGRLERGVDGDVGTSNVLNVWERRDQLCEVGYLLEVDGRQFHVPHIVTKAPVARQRNITAREPSAGLRTLLDSRHSYLPHSQIGEPREKVQRDCIEHASDGVGCPAGNEARMNEFPHEGSGPRMGVEEFAVRLRSFYGRKDYRVEKVIPGTG